MFEKIIVMKNCKYCIGNMNKCLVTGREMFYSLYDNHIYNSIEEVEISAQYHKLYHG